MINEYLEKLKREIKITKALLRSRSASNGMTYIELIVVLSIFAVLSTVAIYNYGAFQDRVDLKNLASDIALQIVGAQKSSLNGTLPPAYQYSLIGEPGTWKPSYGVYFNIANPGGDNKSFIYFTDVLTDNFYTVNSTDCSWECLNKISIVKGNNYISRIDSYSGSNITPITNPLSITFKRPDSSAIFSYSDGHPLTGFDYIQITVKSPKGTTALIKIYPSGRIQVN